MTPYTDRRNAGHYDPQPEGNKTPASEKTTTTSDLTGLGASATTTTTTTKGGKQ